MMLRIIRKATSAYLPMLIAFFTFLLCVPTSVKSQTNSNVEDLVKSLSGGKLKVETKAAPYRLTGDFNRDKIEDVAVVVSLSDTLESIKKTLNIEYPYAFGKEVDSRDLALFIIHGKGKGWQVAQKSAVLLLGRNSALIFQKDRLGETGDRMELEIDKRGKTSIYFITEGADGTLKWNGRKYVWTESH